MLRVHQHFTGSIVVLFSTLLFLCGAITYWTLKANDIEHFKEKLTARIEIIKLQKLKFDDLEQYSKIIKEKIDSRITFIDDNGAVLADSDTLSESMENHNNREEIMQARKQPYGTTLRYSQTLNEDFLYVAHRFEIEGEPVFIRLSASTKSIVENFYSLWLKITLIFAIFIFIALFNAYKLGDKIKKDVNKIKNALLEIANKNYDYVVEKGFTQEFIEIGFSLRKLAAKLHKRDKLKKKYTTKLKLANKQRSDIISAISHEFKNPITSIMGYAQTLMDDGDANKDIRQKFLGKIIQNSQKITNMVDRLALSTKFENGDLLPRLSQFDIATLAKELVDGFAQRYPERKFILSLESCIVEADKTMMEMVIINLIENAIKYSEEDVEIKIKDKTLHVIDKGIGISQEDLSKVTRKFYRSQSSTWDNSMGLGLSLVSYILKLHKMELHIQSEVDVGSDFSFGFCNDIIVTKQQEE
ncbi:MAG: ATP-binding protein [Sulfurospirillaceae bacterium]|nr:ATP-binding protein [Sulfurospirillaceae bacterium]